MRQRKPFAEPPFNYRTDTPAMAELVDSLTHYDLDNGWIVSVLRNQGGYWETMEWRWGDRSDPRHGHGPLYFDTEAEALAHRDNVARRV